MTLKDVCLESIGNVSTFKVTSYFNMSLKLMKNRPPLHVSLNNNWPLGQKIIIQIFERWSSCGVIEGNVQGGLTLQP